MARTYNKPPLIEALCDFRFSSSQPWDWTIPGLYFEQIRDKFPYREQMNVVETLVDTAQGKLVQQTQPKIQFVNEDRTIVIQVAPNNLSIHQLHPYDGWYNFKERILEYLSIYEKAAHPTSLTRIGLRYVNHIELSPLELELEDYFRVLPQVPKPIPQIFPSFLLNVEVPYDSPRSNLRITFGTIVPRTPNNYAYLLDIDLSSINDTIPSSSEVSYWLEVAHGRIEDAFNAAFTDKTHFEIFEEVSK